MISPIDIRQHSFKRGIRGFDTDEVKAFLQSLAQEWQQLLAENGRLEKALDTATARLERYQETEAMLQKTLQHAEQSSAAITENARKEAAIIVQEAEQKAYEIVQQALKERERLERDIQDLNARRNDILVQMKSFLNAQVERIAAFRTEEAVQLPKLPEVKVPTRKTVEQPTARPQPSTATETDAGAASAEAAFSPAKERESILKRAQTSFFDTALAKPDAALVEDLVDEL